MIHQKNRTKLMRYIPLLLLVAVGISGIIWLIDKDQGNKSSGLTALLSNRNSPKEYTPDPYSPDLDRGVSLPVEAKFILLNNPQSRGDVVELELMFTSRLAEANIVVSYILPDRIRPVSGGNGWTGVLEQNETKHLSLNVIADTEKLSSVQAKLTISKDDYSFTRGVAYHIDLGEQDHAQTEEISVSGYQGGNKLNLIKPKKK